MLKQELTGLPGVELVNRTIIFQLHQRASTSVSSGLACRSVVQDCLKLKLFLTFYHDDRRSLYTSTIVMGAAQHAHMESSVNAVVSRYVQNIVDWTRLSKDLERSKQLARIKSLESDMLTVKLSHLFNLILHIHALFISILL